MAKGAKKQRQIADITIGLNVAILKEGRTFVVYAPALDLVGQGKTIKEAQRDFEEVMDIYLEETLRKGTLEKDLLRCGWQKHQGSMQPPAVSKFPVSEKLGKDMELTAIAIMPLDAKKLCPA